MDLHPVESTNIVALGYNPDTKTLGVQFQSGDVWHYADVPDYVYQMLCGAESCGREFARHVKPNYTGTKQPKVQEK